MANELANLKPPAGSTKKRTRVGRGEGSGKGRTAGRGQKGYGSRSGSGVNPGFEGGQMPLQRRLPKRGFWNPFSKHYTVINLDTLEGRFEADAVVDLDSLHAAGIVAKKGKDGLKVLGRGELSCALTIKAAKFSKTATAKIAAAGGTAEIV
ncbi:MAG TPA: 50S ribosomal protein L15 [Myxococcota bacterium]|nr:50S ribosomal protein L15 [Myxococcota bacterium]